MIAASVIVDVTLAEVFKQLTERLRGDGQVDQHGDGPSRGGVRLHGESEASEREHQGEMQYTVLTVPKPN